MFFGHAEAALEVGEALYAEHGVADDEERPPLADDVEGAGDGADAVFIGLVLHDSPPQEDFIQTSCILQPHCSIQRSGSGFNGEGRKEEMRCD